MSRPGAFVLMGTDHGTLIVNRNDYFMDHGVGLQLMQRSAYEAREVGVALSLLEERLNLFGPGLVAMDCGANIGVHTIEWARFLTGWGSVIAFEPQQFLFYALAGNIVLNNVLNAEAHYGAVGAAQGVIQVPLLDYTLPASYGSLELRPSITNEPIGQSVDYATTRPIGVVAIDDYQLPRLDLLKLDIEGMEMEALRGARETIRRCKPDIMVEVIKSDKEAIRNFLAEFNYSTSWGTTMAVATMRAR